MLHVTLKVVGGEMESNEIALDLPAIIGRGRDVTLNLSHPLVSRRHCEVREDNGQLRVRDLGSLNGTFVGRERIDEAVLWPGELLTVGTVTFRAVYDTSDVLDPGVAIAQPVDGGDRPSNETLRVDSPANPSDTQIGPHVTPRSASPHRP